jgi:hypothetical protein
MWRGTGATTLAASGRHFSLRSRTGRLGARSALASKTGAVSTTTAVGFGESDCFCSDTAQHASASAWVRTCADRDSSLLPLCIGQSASAQHSIRASGVAAHPAQRAPLAPRSVRVSAKARVCRKRPTTCLGCSTAAWVSNQDPALPYATVASRPDLPNLALEVVLPRLHPGRIVPFGDLDGAVSQQLGDAVEGDAL